MNKILKGVVACFLFEITGISHAAVIFTDNFDDPAFTNANWLDGTPAIPQTWSFITLNGSDLGYQSTVDILSTTDPAVKYVTTDNFYNAGLNMDVAFRIDSHPDAGTVDTNKVTVGYGSQITGEGYEIGIKIDNGGASSLFISGTKLNPIFGEPPISETNLDVSLLPISFDTFYKLSVQVDSNQTTVVSLFDLNDTLLGSVSTTKFITTDVIDFAAIAGRYASTYNNFSLSGTVVPIPAAVWLFGSGILSLIGIARRRTYN